jgi:hypothetical protein
MKVSSERLCREKKTKKIAQENSLKFQFPATHQNNDEREGKKHEEKSETTSRAC